MPGSGKKKKKRSGSQALGAEDTGSAKESEETSFGDNDEEDLMSPKVFLNDKINVFQQKYPRTLGEISTMFNDEDNIMVMISTYEDYEDKDEFDELLSLNVDIVRNMIANGRFSKAAFEQVYRALPSAEKSGHVKGAGLDTKEVAIVEDAQSTTISSVGVFTLGRIGIYQVSDPTTKSSEVLLTIEGRAIKC